MSIKLVEIKKDSDSDTLPPSTPSLFAQYVQERSNKHVIETDKGFATYLFVQDGIYAEDVYVKPEFRRSNVASIFGDKIAKIGRQHGYKKMYGSVKPSSNQATESLKFLLAYGFKLLHAGPDAITLVKDI